MATEYKLPFTGEEIEEKLNKVSQLSATATELNYVDGVTSNIQTQLDGKAASSHNHPASNITSGTLGVARGGTGKDFHTLNAVLTGNGTGEVNNVATASGALYATGANSTPNFGTLPIAQGGTGAKTASAARTNLGVYSTTEVDGKIASTFSGSYNDLTDKPTTLPNPNALTITLGSTKYTYDGSKAVSVTIQDGNGVAY